MARIIKSIPIRRGIISYGRERMRITQEELAHAVGVHVRTIRRWENCESYPRTKELALKLAKALGMSFNDIT